jgi:2-polyprenyl-3-methyl-5-hydroxy-6-metoxy-1,4-benzoquinol methylase
VTRIGALFDAILNENARQGSLLSSAESGLLPDEREELEAYLDFEASVGATVSELARAYNLVVLDTLREQLYFRRHRRYRHQRFADVANSVYFSDEYMRLYMKGLALTAYLWPNHVEIRRFFQREVANGPCRGRYLEVGPGHGLYMAAALRSGRFSRCLGVDISPTSLELTRAVVGRYVEGSDTSLELALGDFLAMDVPGTFDVVVMGEVLEHVERPAEFLARARAACSEGGRVFISTCANSPATDHIYLFRHDSEVDELAEAAGLAVLTRLVVPYHGTTLEQSYRQSLPVNVAMVLSR